MDIYNTAIKMFAEKCSVEFLDLSYEFDVADGRLWSSRDGVHLSSHDGVPKLMDALLRHSFMSCPREKERNTDKRPFVFLFHLANGRKSVKNEILQIPKIM